MPRITSENSNSPERPSRHSRFKASTPIEIPRRRSTASSPNSPTSPDMLFEMSPVSPTFPPASSMYPSASQLRAHEKTNPHERFMYHVPIIRPSTDISGSQLRRKNSRQNVIPFRNNNIVAFRSGTEVPDITVSEGCIAHSSETAHNVPPSKEHIGNKRIQSTTKITGFTPINEHQPPIHEKPPRPTIPLHPPPRRPSFSSSPWILPGRIDHCEDNFSYSQVDPSHFEFQRHLLRRIENQDSSRLKSILIDFNPVI